MRGGRAFVIAAVVMAAGCFDHDLVDCGDGTACPASYMCLPSGGCANAAQLAACADVVDGETCFVDGKGFGTCVDDACIVKLCGNGRVEPGEACDDGNDVSGDGCNATCTSTGACGNAVIDPGEECDCGDGTVETSCSESNDPDASSTTATCRSDCRLVRCGNGLHDAGEVCDDGNLMVADGCTPDCLSDESCGNGKLDFFAGELCEDGNTRNHDGCDNTCQPEQPYWHRIAQEPLGKVGTAMVDDGHGGRALMFGGSTKLGVSTAETWAWSGTGWRQLFPLTSPSPRHSHAMAYDSERHRVVLFGGTPNGTSLLGDTWEFDGHAWTQRSPALSPSPRFGHSMAYDSARHRVVLFGGRTNETWLWDGTNWSLATPTTNPPIRSFTGLAYDVDRGLVIMYGGVGGGAVLEDLWLWNGSDWTEVPKTTPWPSGSRRFKHALVYDRERKLTVLLGGLSGQSADAASSVAAVYGLGASGWTSLPALPGAPACYYDSDIGPVQRTCERESPAAAYHSASKSVVVFGGHFGALYGRETLQLPSAAVSWNVVGTPVVTARTNSAMTYDSLHASTVLFGGQKSSDGDYLGDTWRWDGTIWRDLQLSWPAAPTPHIDHALVEDPLREQILFYGGQDLYEGPTYQTWALRGDVWSDLQIPIESSPGTRWTHGMSLAPSRDVVMFGGTDTQTWTWTGGWTQNLPANSPSSTAAAMALDARRGRTVLVSTGETLEWNGTTWSSVLSLPTAPGRFAHTVAYDPLRGETLVHGGQEVVPNVGFVTYGDTLSWNGTEWTTLVPGGEDPGVRSAHTMTYDAARSELLVFDGDGETWSMRWEGHGLDEVCHSGSDLDGDGKVGCADDECWPWCDPLCGPGAQGCPVTRPRCGDGTCSSIESYHSCPGDCASKVMPICGDFVCDPGETCAGECP